MGEGAKRSEAQRQLTPGHRRYKAYAGSTASTVRVQIYLEIKAKHFCCYLLKHLELISGDQIQNLDYMCIPYFHLWLCLYLKKTQIKRQSCGWEHFSCSKLCRGKAEHGSSKWHSRKANLVYIQSAISSPLKS